MKLPAVSMVLWYWTWWERDERIGHAQITVGNHTISLSTQECPPSSVSYSDGNTNAKQLDIVVE